MSRIRTVIADDEPIARSGMRGMLAGIPWIEVVGEAANGPAAVEIIDRLKPDLVFLDIQMPGLPGTDVLRRIAHQPHVVFTTAFAQHAVTAFELGALDYLLKPFGAERLEQALERIRGVLGEAGSGSLGRLAETFGQGPISRLFVRSGGSIIPVAVSSVAWFEARGDYVAAHAGASRHLLHLSLNHLEGRLDPLKFTRIHRTHIVNLDHVKAFRKHERQLVAELADGTRLTVSRARAHDLRGLAS